MPRKKAESEDSAVTTEETPSEEQESTGTQEEDFFPKTDEEGGEEESGETSSTEEEDATSEKDDGEADGLAEELTLDDFEEPEEPEDKKSGVQKRIDQLTARLRSVEEENEKLRQSSPTAKTQEYSENQLRTAMSKAMEDGDANLMWEIMDYRLKKERNEAVKEYQKEQEVVVEQRKKQQQEWLSVIEEYSYLSDSDEPELYKGSHKDLNIGSRDSMVYKLAAKLYSDPSKAERYGKYGGQRLAVSDAIRMILRKKNSKVTSKETKKLKRQLAKEKKKSTVSSGKAVKSEKTTPAKANTSLEDYLAERRQTKAHIAGAI